LLNRKNIIRAMAYLLLVLLLFFGLRAWQQRGLVQGVAPLLLGESVDGQLLDSRRLRGRPMLVYFWASWCPVCKLQNPNVEAVARDYNVIGVAMRSGGGQEVRDYMQAHGLDFPALADEDGSLSARFRVRAVPTSFIVDPRGDIHSLEVGFTSEWGLRARLWLADQ
jgi:thiol-disulfide isomerase/thioredoxin